MEHKAVLLFSGGLDCSLAYMLVRDSVDVYGIIFSTPFAKLPKRVFEFAGSIKLPLKEYVIRDEYFNLIFNPEFGFGKGMNPCLDCHILMLQKAKLYMEKIRAEFIVTGEVLNQRMMSQKRRDLFIAEEKTELRNLILRPLSAKLLPETVPESEGIIDRNELMDISGKSRKAQLELARRFQLSGYGTPAGGCVLTDQAFSARLRDTVNCGELTVKTAALLKVGRHFRLANGTKLIVPRNENEDIALHELGKPFFLITPRNNKGPCAVILKNSDVEQAVSFLSRYNRKETVFVVSGNNSDQEIVSSPAGEEEIRQYLI